MRALLTANVRPSNTELNTLITALKFRFLHLLAPDDQRPQADLLLDGGRTRTRPTARPAGRIRAAARAFSPDWLDHHIAALEDRLAWIARFRDRLDFA